MFLALDMSFLNTNFLNPRTGFLTDAACLQYISHQFFIDIVHKSRQLINYSVVISGLLLQSDYSLIYH